MLALALVVASRAGGACAAGVEAEAAGSRIYDVRPVSKTVRLQAPPEAPVEASGAFTIRRRGAPPQERVYYSVEGAFYSAEGRSMPGDVVQISGVAGEWASHDVLVLDAGQDRAEFRMRVLPQAWYEGDFWRYAGDYRGYLVASVQGASAISVTVRIDPVVRVEASPGPFEVVAHSGVGAYEAAEPVVVTVQANHSGWLLSRSFEEPVRQEKPKDRIPLSQVRISEDGGPFLPVYGHPEPWLRGSDLPEPRLVVRELRLQVEVTWEELAGRYEGNMELTVESGK